MTSDEVNLCGAVPRPGDDDYERPGQAACDGVGEALQPGPNSVQGIRYLECPKCGRTWRIVFKPVDPADAVIGWKA